MTSEEAINIIKSECYVFNPLNFDRSTMVNTALDMAIKALKEPVLDKIRAEIIEEKDFAYADFDRYKEEVLCVEPDELPDDDYRYGMERCIEILDKYKAEMENK